MANPKRTAYRLKTSTFSYKHKKPRIFSLESLWKWKAIIAKFTPNYLIAGKGYDIQNQK